MGQLFFDEECIYEIIKPYLKLVMDGDGWKSAKEYAP